MNTVTSTPRAIQAHLVKNHNESAFLSGRITRPCFRCPFGLSSGLTVRAGIWSPTLAHVASGRKRSGPSSTRRKRPDVAKPVGISAGTEFTFESVPAEIVRLGRQDQP